MTAKVKSLVEALHPRACNVAELLASRLEDPGLWRGYQASERLQGELRFSDLLVYKRQSIPMAVLVFRNPEIVDATEVDWGNAEVRSTDRQVERGSTFSAKPVEVVEKVSHTWSKTKSLLEQVNAGLEAGIKAGAEVGAQGGIHGITAKVYAEIYAKISADYGRKWGEESTESRTSERTVTYQGPGKLDFEFSRSISSLVRTIRTSCDYTHSVELIDERQGIKPDNRPAIQEICDTWNEFKSVVQGFAPRSKHVTVDDKTVVVDTGFYSEFITNPIRGDAFEALTKPVDAVVELVVPYERATSYDFKIL